MIYLDYVSSTPVDKLVEKAYLEVLDKYYANSDSLHDLGREVSALVDTSRTTIANLFNVNKNEVIFTSGASESNSLAIKGTAFKRMKYGKHIITSSYEHSSIMNSMKQLSEVFGFEITYLKPNDEGIITLDSVKSVIRDDTILVSVMYINNEIGAINPVNEIANFVKKNSHAYMHVDCVQALGKYPIDLTNIDLATFSMHKIFGVKGSGLLIKKNHVELEPLISGGEQELGIRGGTTNNATCIIAAKTIRMALEDEKKHFDVVSELHDYLVNKLKNINGIIFNSKEKSSVYIVNFSYPNIASEIMLNALNKAGFAVSAQSTCNSKTKTRSHVLKTMGYSNEVCDSSIRIGLSYLVTKDDLDLFIKALKETIQQYG